MGIHAIDTARFLLGEPQPRRVVASIRTAHGDYAVDDDGIVLIEWESGARSVVESGWWQPHADGPEAATQLYGTQGFGQVFPTKLEMPNVLDSQAVPSIHNRRFPIAAAVPGCSATRT